ncbi:MAG: SDR family oxidoreductase [Candidatus Omnitrophica bacterium]|nr:SDR family oxidoreductase [Candidatus Omnitrophota bacterium]
MKHRALVTGGTRGIGAAIAAALVEAGHDVTVSGTARPPRRVPKRCRYLDCDFSDPTALEAFTRKVAGLNLSILVNNAGINTVGPLESYDPENFSRIQQVNVTAPFRLCQAVVPGMRKRRFGRIVNITSIFGVVSKAGRCAYSASKFALLGLSRALALEVAAENVLVNCLAPGFVDTELTRGILGARGIAKMKRLIPMGRLARPEEIARAVRFLVSEENTYMTGQQVVVDGGFISG